MLTLKSRYITPFVACALSLWLALSSDATAQSLSDKKFRQETHAFIADFREEVKTSKRPWIIEATKSMRCFRDFLQYCSATSYDPLGLFLSDIDYSKAILKLKDSVVRRLAFTPQERRTLFSMMSRESAFKWTQDLVGSAHLITYRTLDSLFQRNNSAEIDAGWNSIPSEGYFEMSQPIFLRNYTLCVFYYGNPCGLTCGYGTVSIYRKEAGQWREIKSLFSWDS